MPDKVKNLGVLETLVDLGLEKIVLSFPTFVFKVVLEFYANLSSDISDTTSPNAFKSFVRGVTVNFSSKVINDFLGFKQHWGPSMVGALGLIAHEITGGVQNSWPKKRGNKSLCLNLQIFHLS